jgi:hypothetical protein
MPADYRRAQNSPGVFLHSVHSSALIPRTRIWFDLFCLPSSLSGGQKKSPFRGFLFATSDSLSWHYVNALTRPIEPIEVDNAVDQSEESEVAAHADVSAGMDTRAELANNNVSCTHGLAAEHFHAAPLPFAITSVTGASSSFLMCHL